MFTKQQQRMLKCGLSALYAEEPDWAAYPLYFMERSEGRLEDTIRGVSALQSLEQIPWPEESCIIICEDNLLSRWFATDVQVLHFYLRGRHKRLEADVKAKDYMKKHKAEPVIGLVVALDKRGDPFVEEHEDIILIRFDNSAVQRVLMQTDPSSGESIRPRSLAAVARATTEAWVQQVAINWPVDQLLSAEAQQLCERLEGQHPGAISPDHSSSAHLEGVILQALPRGAEQAWMALRTTELSDESDTVASFGQAVCILAHLLNIVMPCGYRVKACFREGFGTKRMRRLTRGKPIYCHVGYNRMATMTKEASEHAPIDPHFVRGHIRNLWKRAGLDRAFLPLEPHKRLLLVQQHKVKRVYVHPYWTGPRSGYHDGVDWEIEQGESELPEL